MLLKTFCPSRSAWFIYADRTQGADSRERSEQPKEVKNPIHGVILDAFNDQDKKYHDEELMKAHYSLEDIDVDEHPHVRDGDWLQGVITDIKAQLTRMESKWNVSGNNDPEARVNFTDGQPIMLLHGHQHHRQHSDVEGFRQIDSN